MKKFPFILICLIMLTGCAKKNNVNNPADVESSGVITETAVPAAQPEKVVSKSGFNITPDGIEVIRRGEIWQTLEDTNIFEVSGQLGNISIQPEDYLIKKDFDNDCHLDLFVPYLVSDDRKGVYYHFDPDTALYEKWDAFNEIGIFLEPCDIRYAFHRTSGNETPSYFVHNLENEDIYYSFNNNKLNYAGKTIRYKNDDGEEYTDTFFHNYDKNEEQLVKRIKTTDGRKEEIFVHPNQCWFTVRENCIDIWIPYENGYKTIQTIEGCYQSGSESDGHCTPPKQNAVFRDMDGDGYDDIYIKEGINSGKYFLFNPQTFKFDEV